MLSCGFDGHGGAITSVRHSRRPIASGLAWSETWPAFGYAARRRNRECDREGGTSRVTLRGHAVKGYLRISQRPGSRLGQLVRRSGDVVHAVPTRRVTIRRSHDRLVLTGLPALRSGAGRPPIRTILRATVQILCVRTFAGEDVRPASVPAVSYCLVMPSVVMAMDRRQDLLGRSPHHRLQPLNNATWHLGPCRCATTPFNRNLPLPLHPTPQAAWGPRVSAAFLARQDSQAPSLRSGC